VVAFGGVMLYFNGFGVSSSDDVYSILTRQRVVLVSRRHSWAVLENQWPCLYEGAVSELTQVKPSSSSSSSTSRDQCHEYVVIIDDIVDSSSNVSLCVTRGRQLPVYRSRDQQVRVYVTTRRPFLLVYHGITYCTSVIHDNSLSKIVVTCAIYCMQ